MNLPPTQPQKLIPDSLNQKRPSNTIKKETQSELDLTDKAWKKLSKRRDSQGQLKRYLIIVNFAINVWMYSSLLAMAIRQLFRTLYRLANALTSFSIWAAPNWCSIRATLITFYGSLPWTDSLNTIRTYWGIGQLLAFAQWYVHGIVEIGFALRELPHWPYPKKMLVIYTFVFFITLLFSPIPPHSPPYMLGVVCLGGIGSVYLFARWLQYWADN